jgi:hypothetical protein
MKYLLSVFFIVFLQGCVSLNFNVNKPNKKKEKIYPKTINTNEIIQNKPDKKIQKKSDFLNIKTTNLSNNQKKIIYSGSIKGIIQKLSYDKVKHSWLYEVQGIDTSNQKLPYARFYHYKKLANEGDLVYIILDNSNLKNLFFIKKTNKIKKQSKKSIKPKKIKHKRITHKLDKRRKTAGISLPTVEHVDF